MSSTSGRREAEQGSEGLKVSKRAFIIAGTSSNTGKTTVAAAIMAALKRRGLVVQPFKAGPDYIDPSHHEAAAGRPSYNLDTWMMGAGVTRETFFRALEDADVGVVEGVMGLFDGKAGESGGEGSTAHLAKVLGLGVILVVDARSMAGSAAALVHGFESFDEDVRITGVVFNRVGSPRHAEMLRDAVERRCRARVLGCLPADDGVAVPSRHLGLVMPYQGRKGPDTNRLASLVEGRIDLEVVLRAATEVVPGRRHDPGTSPSPAGPRPRIAVARDRAFCFYYRQNIDMLEGFGAEVVFFSPLEDRRLPEGTDGIYLGGGYPELHAADLEANTELREEVRRFCRRGGPVYAECGGLMYLGKGLTDVHGRSYAMAGVFPWTSRMLPRKRSLGYREVEVIGGCPFIERGQRIRGHEFHYSETTPHERIPRTYKMTGAGDGAPIREGYLYRNTLASYIHLHFASNPCFAEGFVARCMEAKEGAGKGIMRLHSAR